MSCSAASANFVLVLRRPLPSAASCSRCKQARTDVSASRQQYPQRGTTNRPVRYPEQGVVAARLAPLWADSEAAHRKVPNFKTARNTQKTNSSSAHRVKDAQVIERRPEHFVVGVKGIDVALGFRHRLQHESFRLRDSGRRTARTFRRATSTSAMCSAVSRPMFMPMKPRNIAVCTRATQNACAWPPARAEGAAKNGLATA
jgi:hypothetical protein